MGVATGAGGGSTCTMGAGGGVTTGAGKGLGGGSGVEVQPANAAIRAKARRDTTLAVA